MTDTHEENTHDPVRDGNRFHVYIDEDDSPWIVWTEILHSDSTVLPFIAFCNEETDACAITADTELRESTSDEDIFSRIERDGDAYLLARNKSDGEPDGDLEVRVPAEIVERGVEMHRKHLTKLEVKRAL